MRLSQQDRLLISTVVNSEKSDCKVDNMSERLIPSPHMCQLLFHIYEIFCLLGYSLTFYSWCVMQWSKCLFLAFFLNTVQYQQKYASVALIVEEGRSIGLRPEVLSGLLSLHPRTSTCAR